MKTLVYLPEGLPSDYRYFSGISYFFSRALAREAALRGISLHTVEFPECLEVEELLHLSFGPNGGGRERVADWKLSRWINPRLLEALAKRPSADEFLSLVHEYWRACRAELERRWPPSAPPGSPLLALSPFYPYWGPSSSLSIYTDCCNTAFFMEGPYATLAGVQIPEAVRVALAAQEGSVLTQARTVFTYSGFAAADLVSRYGISLDRLVIAGAGANLAVSPPLRVRWCGRSPFRVLFVGKDFVRKGGPTVVSVAEQIPEAKFTIVSTVAGAAGAARNLSFHPPVAPDAIHGCFSAADAFLFPTRYEPYGLVVCEAMHHSLPVVTSNVGAMPELVPQPSMVQRVDDTDGFVDVIRQLMENPLLRMQIAEENFEHARRMTWRRAAARILTHLFSTP